MSFERKERFLFWKEVVCGVFCRLAYIGSDAYLLEWSFLAIFFVRFESDLYITISWYQYELDWLCRLYLLLNRSVAQVRIPRIFFFFFLILFKYAIWSTVINNSLIQFKDNPSKSIIIAHRTEMNDEYRSIKR